MKMPPDEGGDPADADDEKQGETESAKVRHWLTNDAAALVFTGTLCLLILMGQSPWFTIPKLIYQTFAASAFTAVVWLFGRGAAKAVLGGGKR